jgi:hypothetical protein
MSSEKAAGYVQVSKGGFGVHHDLIGVIEFNLNPPKLWYTDIVGRVHTRVCWSNDWHNMMSIARVDLRIPDWKR